MYAIPGVPETCCNTVPSLRVGNLEFQPDSGEMAARGAAMRFYVGYDGSEYGVVQLPGMVPLTTANLLGLPAMVVPFSLTDDGLPIGIQLIGRPYEEERLLELAMRLEEARGPFYPPEGY